MSWADAYIDRLLLGHTVQFRPRGNSMAGIIGNGQLVTVEPVLSDTPIRKGDVVLCRVHGQVYLHLVTGVTRDEGVGRYQISNNHGRVNGWTSTIYGIVTGVAP